MVKKKEIKLPAFEESNHPFRNFLVLLVLIPLAPAILIYSIVTGRLQNPFITGACLTMILIFGGYYAYNKYFNHHEKTIHEKLNPMIDELTEEERANLKKQVSTLRAEIGEDKLPKSLKPMLDIKMNMININYFYYLVNSGNMGADGNGAVYILQNALYSGNYTIMKAAWESLYYINTEDSKRIMALFSEDIERVKTKRKVAAEQAEKKREQNIKPQLPPESDFDKMKWKWNRSFMNFRHNMSNRGFGF